MKKKKEKTKNQPSISRFFTSKSTVAATPQRTAITSVTASIVLSSDDELPVSGENNKKRPRSLGDTPPRKIKKCVIDESIVRNAEREKRLKRENLAEIDSLFTQPRPSSEIIPSQEPTQESSQTNVGDIFNESSESLKFESDDGFDDELPLDVLELCSQPKFALSNKSFKGRGKVVNIADKFATVENENGEYFDIPIEPEWYLHVDDIVHSPPSFGSIQIAHSDTLVSCTAISTAAMCPRHAVLADRFRDGEMGIGNKNMLLGNMLHTLVQEALVEAVDHRIITANYIKEHMATILQANFENIITCGESIKTMEIEAKSYYTVVSNLINALVKQSLPIDLNFTHPENVNRTKARVSVS